VAGLTSRALAKACAEIVLVKKAEDVIIIDLRKLAAPTDFFVLCTGTSERHVKALADGVVEEMKKQGVRPWHMEGGTARKWVLVDYVDVVVHVFMSDTRRFYSLETLWGDAPSMHVKPKVRRVRTT
jgi:ribosome-associated protein